MYDYFLALRSLKNVQATEKEPKYCRLSERNDWVRRHPSFADSKGKSETVLDKISVFQILSKKHVPGQILPEANLIV